jgi:6,7-dimethyl-8-ribityllumazine synthase
MASTIAKSNGRLTPRVGVVVSRYNAGVTDQLLEGARAVFTARAGGAAQIEVIQAPGSFELPALSLAAARTGRFDGIVALGCLIKGETSHDRVIADAVAHGLVGVTLATGVPVTFGVLTTDTPEQAMVRAGGAQGNKGADAMAALLDTIASIQALGAQGAPTGARLSKPDKTKRSISR